jgi:hypothetical protein
MAYIAWVRYGTSNSGYDEYLGLSLDGEDTTLVNNITRTAIRFDTLDEAKEAVHLWCEKTRAGLIRAGLHSGKSWNQTREGAWKYEEVEDTLLRFNKPTTIWEF